MLPYEYFGECTKVTHRSAVAVTRLLGRLCLQTVPNHIGTYDTRHMRVERPFVVLPRQTIEKPFLLSFLHNLMLNSKM